MFNISNCAGLKVFLHVGAPKSGSTSFQHALQSVGADFLCSHRIAYLPDGGSNNNSEIYKLIINEDHQGLTEYIYNIIEYAIEIGAENIIISAERLFVVDDIKNKFRILSEIFNKLLISIELVAVIRELNNYLNSYIRQLIYNGSILLPDSQLASWTVGQMMDLVRSGFAVRILQYEDLASSGNLPSALLQRMGFSNVVLTNQRVNVTPDRPLLYALAEGALARIEAGIQGFDVNALDLDAYRTDCRQKYDAMEQENISGILQISKEIDYKIDQYINNSIASMPGDRRHFYDELKSGGELFVPCSLPVIPAAPLCEAAARHVRATNWLNKMRKGERSG